MNVLGQVWLQAYCAAIAGGNYLNRIAIADQAVEEYKNRYPNNNEPGKGPK